MKLLPAVAAVATAGLAYCLVEARIYALRQLSLPAPKGMAGLRALHISDLHLAPWDKDRAAWVAGLARLNPDVVIASGDFLAHQQSMPLISRALSPLMKFPGVFVLGSNDYFAPRLKNPLRYLGKNTQRTHGAALPTTELTALMTSNGWLDLDNQRGSLNVDGAWLEFRGTGDAHIGYDDYGLVAGDWKSTSQLRVSVTHAPYARVLTAMAADSPDVIFAGHTHGGQITIPFVTALTTNSDLPVRQARGLSSVANPSGGDIPLHVSAGVGTSPFFPVRLGCRPEATLLTFTAAH
jgi:uncharacterized protein